MYKVTTSVKFYNKIDETVGVIYGYTSVNTYSTWTTHELNMSPIDKDFFLFYKGFIVGTSHENLNDYVCTDNFSLKRVTS